MIPLRIKFTLNVLLASLVTAALLIVTLAQPALDASERTSASTVAKANAAMLSTALASASDPESLSEALRAMPQLPLAEAGIVFPVAANGEVTGEGSWSWDSEVDNRYPDCALASLGAAVVAYQGAPTVLCDGTWIGTAVTTTPDGTHSWVVLSWRHSETLAFNLSLLPILLIEAAIMVVACAMVGWRASGPINRTASSAVRVAERFRRGDRSARMNTDSDDEFGLVATSFNAAADDLVTALDSAEDSAGRQRRLLSEAAHELRTPVSALLASATALEHPGTRDEAAVRVAPQLRRLASLTEDLLELSRLDAGRVAVVTDEVALHDLAEEVADEYGAEVSASVEPVLVHTDPMRVRSIVVNLVGNALRHGQPPVVIGVSADGDTAFVTVTDAGEGVPAGHREEIFWRFTQLDASRHQEGAGLGLAIARDSARLLGGELTLDDDGRTFRLQLPGATPVEVPDDWSADTPVATRV